MQEMKIEQIFKFELKRSEAYILKKMLGCITDVKKKEIGLSSTDIELMRTLWYSLPFNEEEV